MFLLVSKMDKTKNKMRISRRLLNDIACTQLQEETNIQRILYLEFTVIHFLHYQGLHCFIENGPV